MKYLVLLFTILHGTRTIALCPDASGNFAGITKTFTEILQEQQSVVISINETVLMDQSPPDTYTITVESNGKLVWNPNADIELDVYSITVHGEMHIGGETCRYEKDTTITFNGDVGADKGLFTFSGSTFEIHGKDKLAWSKITATSPKHVFLVDAENQNVQTATKNGLVLFEIDPSTGALVGDANIYNFLKSQASYTSNLAGFAARIDAVTTGNIIALGIRSTIVKPGRDLIGVYSKIEQIMFGSDGRHTNLRNVQDGSAYVMVVKKGTISTAKEKMVSPTGSDVVASESTVIDGLNIEISSYISVSLGGKNNVNLQVADETTFKPSVTLVDSNPGWEIGDKVVITSTDFDWKQVEEKTILSISGSTLRFEETNDYEHYGEIYKNVDMRAEVALLSRNIKFTSIDADSDETYNGHIRFHKGFNTVSVEGAEFENLGQSKVLGSYPLHFHMCEDVDTDPNNIPYLRQNSVHHSNSRCFTIHGTSGVVLTDNVCYLSKGHGYFFEDGGEQRNTLDGNLGLGQTEGILIPTDKFPATFWVTNPDNKVRNSVAAGGDGPAFWYTYPESPLGPSASKNMMLKHQARHTAIAEFFNNVAHSHKNKPALMIDNELDENGNAAGYNQYYPVEDPIRHLNFGDSPEKEVVLSRVTVYKSMPYCVWVRGGRIKMERVSVSDCAVGVTLLRDTPAEQFLVDSVIIGDSPNKGEPTKIAGVVNSLGRSFPFGQNDNSKNTMRIGYEYMKGPAFVERVWFGHYISNSYYTMGAIGFRTGNERKNSPINGVKSVKYGFPDYSDGSGGNRVLDMKPGDQFYSEEDGDKIASFRDLDCSVSGISPCVTNYTTIVRPYPFYQTGNCENRLNWNMMICEEEFGQIRVGNMSRDITVYRDDDISNKYITADANEDAAFNVILGGDYSYSFEFQQEVPATFKVKAFAFTHSMYVRLGMCIPPNAEFDLKSKHPEQHTDIESWTLVSSPQALDTAAENDDYGGKYFYNQTTGYLALVVRNKKDFDTGDTSDCPDDDCYCLTVTITSGVLGEVACLEEANAASPLKPSQSRKRRSTSPRLLSRKRRSILNYSADLLADSISPDSAWGASSTRPFPSST